MTVDVFPIYNEQCMMGYMWTFSSLFRKMQTNNPQKVSSSVYKNLDFCHYVIVVYKNKEDIM